MTKANSKPLNFNVLLQVQNQNESERLIALFRTGGMAVRAHRITSEEDFNESIADSNWDLLISDNRHPEVSLKFSLETLKKQQRDIPILLLSDESNRDMRNQAFNLGIQDVIEKNDNIHFIHAAVREMRNARQRINNQRTQVAYQELKTYADSLMNQSDDAIAYVNDGILIKTNDKFAELFGYASDDLDFMSVIDLVSADDHDKFKSSFRYFSKDPGKQTELSVKAIGKDKKTIELQILLSKATLDGEECTQITVPSGEKASGGINTGTTDSASGLHNRYYLMGQITSTALQIGQGIPSACLTLFQIDNSDKILQDGGLSALDYVCADLAALLKQNLGDDAVLARVGDDSVGLILQKSPEKALPQLQQAIKTIEEHICEIAQRSIQYTCLASVIAIKQKDAQISLDQAFAGLNHIRQTHDKNHVEVYQISANTPISADAISNTDEALELNCFKLLYQPLMSLQGDSTEYYETTFSFDGGDSDSYPEALISRSGNTKLDRWIIIETTKALAIHKAKGHDTRLIVNLTSNALNDDSLAPWLSVAIKAANLTSESLIFQFREVDVKNQLKQAIKAIGALRGAKFKVSVGQFGLEEDPFKLLKHLAFDFVQFNASLNSNSASLKELIAHAKENNIQTIIPDVDSPAMLASMWQLGTHYIQGSYLQLPSPEMNYEFTEL